MDNFTTYANLLKQNKDLSNKYDSLLHEYCNENNVIKLAIKQLVLNISNKFIADGYVQDSNRSNTESEINPSTFLGKNEINISINGFVYNDGSIHIDNDDNTYEKIGTINIRCGQIDAEIKYDIEQLNIPSKTELGVFPSRWENIPMEQRINILQTNITRTQTIVSNFENEVNNVRNNSSTLPSFFQLKLYLNTCKKIRKFTTPLTNPNNPLVGDLEQLSQQLYDNFIGMINTNDTDIDTRLYKYRDLVQEVIDAEYSVYQFDKNGFRLEIYTEYSYIFDSAGTTYFVELRKLSNNNGKFEIITLSDWMNDNETDITIKARIENQINNGGTTWKF